MSDADQPRPEASTVQRADDLVEGRSYSVLDARASTPVIDLVRNTLLAKRVSCFLCGDMSQYLSRNFYGYTEIPGNMCNLVFHNPPSLA